MDPVSGENPVAQAIAQALIEGFNKHYRIFRETSRRAKESFEAADWQGQLDAVRERVQFYDDRVTRPCSACVRSSTPTRWTTPPGSRSSCTTSAC